MKRVLEWVQGFVLSLRGPGLFLIAFLVPSLLPPPAPFKIFVLAAGVAQVRTIDFALAVAIGRGTRYFGEGLLAVWYGEAAASYLRDHAQAIALWMAVGALVLGVGWALWQKRRSGPGPIAREN